MFHKTPNNMNTLEKIFAEKLLKIKAIKLQPDNPFTWASGWKSPFYCDNRKTLSYAELRTFVKTELSRLILENFDEVDAIAGVATGAIPQGALVADLLNKPFVYVRSKPKDHGLENLIEGELKPGMKVVVIEDLISTGGSSLKAVEAIRNNGCEVIGMVASYTYGFPVAEKAFKAAKVKLLTLTNYEAVLDVALEIGYINKEQVPMLNEWRKDPAHWME
jgi:orotate phosphoribosyltransferase